MGSNEMVGSALSQISWTLNGKTTLHRPLPLIEVVDVRSQHVAVIIER